MHGTGTARARAWHGRCPESLEALLAPTHTHTNTQDRYPALRGEQRRGPHRAPWGPKEGGRKLMPGANPISVGANPISVAANPILEAANPIWVAANPKIEKD